MNIQRYTLYILFSTIFSCGRDTAGGSSGGTRVIPVTIVKPIVQDTVPNVILGDSINAFKQFVYQTIGLSPGSYDVSKDITVGIKAFAELYGNNFSIVAVDAQNIAKASAALSNTSSVKPVIPKGQYKGAVINRNVAPNNNNFFQLDTAADKRLVDDYIELYRQEFIDAVQIHYLLPIHTFAIYIKYANLIFGNNSMLNNAEKQDCFNKLPSSSKESFIIKNTIKGDWQSFFQEMNKILNNEDAEYVDKKQRWILGNEEYLMENVMKQAPIKVKDKAEKNIDTLFTDQYSIDYINNNSSSLFYSNNIRQTYDDQGNCRINVNFSLQQLREHLVDVQLKGFLYNKVFNHVPGFYDNGNAGVSYTKASNMLYSAFKDEAFKRDNAVVIGKDKKRKLSNDIRYLFIYNVLLPATNHCPQELKDGLERFDLDQHRKVRSNIVLSYPDNINATLLKLREDILDTIAVEINKDDSHMFAQALKKDFYQELNLQIQEGVNIGLDYIWGSRGLDRTSSLEKARESFHQQYTLDTMASVIIDGCDPSVVPYDFYKGIFMPFMTQYIHKANPDYRKDKTVFPRLWTKLGAMYILAKLGLIQVN